MDHGPRPAPLDRAPLIEPSPPVLGQMTMVHEPSLQLLQFTTHLAALLSKAPSLSSLLLGVLAMRGFSGCKARKTVLGPWTGARATVELTAHRLKLMAQITSN